MQDPLSFRLCTLFKLTPAHNLYHAIYIMTYKLPFRLSLCTETSRESGWVWLYWKFCNGSQDSLNCVDQSQSKKLVKHLIGYLLVKARSTSSVLLPQVKRHKTVNKRLLQNLPGSEHHFLLLQQQWTCLLQQHPLFSLQQWPCLLQQHPLFCVQPWPCLMFRQIHLFLRPYRILLELIPHYLLLFRKHLSP